MSSARDPPMALAGRHVVVGVGGGIAAYKAVELVRELMRRGAEVRVCMTESATRFVGPVTFTGITGLPPVVDLWDPSHHGEIHVDLGAWADAIVVAPATANLLARAANGLADDAVLATIACAACPVIYAPAMHHRMWGHAATRRNVERLELDGAGLVGPVTGPLANGESGMGRMAEPSRIADEVELRLARGRDLTGVTVLVTAGPTIEDLDPVRFLGNRSSGKMGIAVASRARDRGARVVLVCGPVSVPKPGGVEVVDVRSALEMQTAVQERLGSADALVMAAAVGDYRPATRSDEKLKKTGESMTLDLVRNPDILAEVGAGRTTRRPVLVGFAVETSDLVEYARRKLVEKRVDLVVANSALAGFGGDANEATLVTLAGAQELPPMDKHALADRILDWLAGVLAP